MKKNNKVLKVFNFSKALILMAKIIIIFLLNKNMNIKNKLIKTIMLNKQVKMTCSRKFNNLRFLIIL